MNTKKKMVMVKKPKKKLVMVKKTYPKPKSKKKLA